MSLKDNFQKATEDVQNLTTRPSDADLLTLYGLYKQVTQGDVTGKRPGFLDLKGRKKFEAWEKKKGIAAEQAMEEYVAFVEKLKTK